MSGFTLLENTETWKKLVLSGVRYIIITNNM